MEPHICRINWQTPDPDDEWVDIANGGIFPVQITGLEITDYTEAQQNPHIYRFPPDVNGRPISLGMYESAVLFTGPGTNRWHTDANGKRWLLLYWGRNAAVWNNLGDVVYLRRLDGQFVDSFTVGHPARHPNGH